MRIGLRVKENMKTVLEEIFNYNFVEIIDFKESFDLAILDIDDEKLEENIYEIKKRGKFLIVLLGEKDIRKMRELFIKGVVDDCVLRKDIYNLEESIERLKNKNSEKEIYLSDNFKKGFYKLEDINYITYSSISRKTEIHLIKKDIFEIRKSFSEIEEQIAKIELFYKVDRSTIVNLENIEIIDLKEEMMIFKNREKIYISKGKLRDVEERCVFLKNRVFLGN